MLHWIDTRAGARQDRSVVYDNYAAACPDWLEAFRGPAALTLGRHDMIEPLPKEIGHFDYVLHAAGIASPIFYRAQPLKTIDANSNGPQKLSGLPQLSERNQDRPLEGASLLLSS